MLGLFGHGFVFSIPFPYSLQYVTTDGEDFRCSWAHKMCCGWGAQVPLMKDGRAWYQYVLADPAILCEDLEQISDDIQVCIEVCSWADSIVCLRRST